MKKIINIKKRKKMSDDAIVNGERRRAKHDSQSWR